MQPERRPARRSLVIVGLLLSLPFFVGCSTRMRRDTVINAPPAMVWNVVADVASYPQWNPYHVFVRGKLAEGEPLEIEIERPNGRHESIVATVNRIIPGEEIAWSWGSWWLAQTYKFRVIDIGKGKTRLVCQCNCSGPGVAFADFSSVAPGYGLVGLAAQARAEARRRGAP